MSSSNTPNTSSIVSKVWAFCNTLRDDGVGYGDYLEQLTYLLYLKMADGTAGRHTAQNAHSNKIQLGNTYQWWSRML